MAIRRPFRKRHTWKSIGFFPYTLVMCYWSLDLIFKAKQKLGSGNRKIPDGRQAAILKVTSLKINRLLPMATNNMHMKFQIENPKQTWVTVQKPCRLQTDGQTNRQTDGQGYLALLPCWVFWHHCATAMLGAQPPLSVGLCPIGTSTSELEWALAMRAMSSRLFVSARLWDMYPCIWGSSGTVCKYLSRMHLKSSTEQRVTFLTSMGSELNNLCPRTGRLA